MDIYAPYVVKEGNDMEIGQAACARCPKVYRCRLTPEQCTARMAVDIVCKPAMERAKQQERDTNDYICVSILRMKSRTQGRRHGR